MPAARKRLWFIPFKTSWPEDLDGKPTAIPIQESGGERVGKWYLKGRRQSQVLKEVREIVARHNSSILSDQANKLKKRTKISFIKGA